MKHQFKGTHLTLVLQVSQFKDPTGKVMTAEMQEKVVILSNMSKIPYDTLASILEKDKVISSGLINKIRDAGIPIPEINFEREKTKEHDILRTSAIPKGGLGSTSTSMAASLTTRKEIA